MRVVPFPRRGAAQDDALVAVLEAALSGESTGREAESWRELRADVRALAPPMSAEVERELWDRIQARSETERESLHPRPMAHAALARLRGRPGPGARRRLIALAGACAVIAVIALAITAPRHSAETSSSSSAVSSRAGELAPAAGPAKATEHARAGSSDSSAAAAVTEAESSQVTPFAKNLGPQAGRVQQRGASITLAPKPAAVQSVADRVAQLAARDGGFVQSSHVSLQHGASGEASLQLSLPSARLSTALAELARLAPARAETQALQDITDEYDADRAKLTDAVAERQALLRALAKASAQGEIESLHARLELAAAAIVHARGVYQAISRRSSNSAVEVTVLGDAHASESSSTVSKGLHDAADVLKVALAVLLVALAVLVPLAILLALLAVGRRATRRRLRERALS
jgi:Domain of unknown function (DUF4349)